ncbi:MAG: molybdopterin-dependent oxidoreductase [Pelagimonas sp.]|jgi:hypothetical protein|nr:molybdopterin-dependent oxidoreductase [Pelagimonas sp.]
MFTSVFHTLRRLTGPSLIRVTVLALGLFHAPVAWAEAPLLTVSGQVAQSAQTTETTPDAVWQFDLGDLRALPNVTVATTTIWTEGPQEFQGVSLRVLLDHVGASGEALRATALNDYAVTIPMADAVQSGPIIAYQRNGQDMSVRDKGPLWIIYPFDEIETYQSEEYYARSIWQLDRIEVLAAQ